MVAHGADYILGSRKSLVAVVVRQGPVPFFKRVADFDLYDQMVLKYNKWPMINTGECYLLM